MIGRGFGIFVVGVFGVPTDGQSAAHTGGALYPDVDCVFHLFEPLQPTRPENLSIFASLPTPKLKPKPKPVIPLDMVRIRPGVFKMGSPKTETKRNGNEGPVQSVKIPYSFEVGRYEVTFNDWRRCVAGGGCRQYSPSDEGWGRGDHPVVNISWNDAQSYIRWLNKETGKKYRLLSEAEWEYVARAGQDTPFYTGQTISTAQANYNGNFPYKSDEKGKYRKRTLPVGRFKSNRFGVYDMLGNALEWTQDCWSKTHKGNPKNGQARTDGDCDYRVMKGGSWVSHGYQIRAAKRTPYTTDYRYEDYGFRIARTLE